MSICYQVNNKPLRRPVERGLGAVIGMNHGPATASRCSIAIPSALQVSAAVGL
jgi:hypothetical protein